MRGAKVVSLSLSAALLAGTVGLTACGTTRNNVKTQSLRHPDGKYNVNSLPQNRMFTRNTNGHHNKINSMRYSAALSNRVAQLKEVQAAHVVVTDRDAYVAITRHGNGVTTHGTHLTTRSNGLVSPNHGIIANGVTNNRGTTNVSGPYGANYGTRGIADNGLAGSSTGILGPVGVGNNMGTGYTTRGTTTDGTLHRMNTTTGTGTTGRVTDRVPQKLKDSIAHTVKKSAPHIRNVYVSEDADFVTEMGNYGTKSRSGAPLHNLTADFQTLINRVFPGRTGTMTGPSGYAPTTPSNVNTNGYRGGVTTDGFMGGVTR
ncbi:sporulation lipoprotein, YhcN/YlaJ family [Fontibacillus panacisegetis]|uniref:Sporulation lipoprotein, YhcN/YlaJ family n=1 Tax=Fontibacillus panacisegetis TaxID=670482 RepID=A0A1G7JT38_9BACL|nr:YhcN/YlaJ family sporulation lipoprotein [Fontibacillus panacisegetis]SDF28088.1 sporulation lipoprotein, YhcN/YlaJ family [Fontibacillus panacisegetis]